MACSMNWSTGQSSLTAVTLTVNLLFSPPPGGRVFISNPFEGEGVGAFLEAGGLIEAIINLGQNMA